MNSYLSLIPIRAKTHRREERMTKLCIVLAVFLVTAIFSMTEMWIRGEMSVLDEKHGDWRVALGYVENLFPIAAVCFVVILLSGVFMISGCMNASVARRTRFFGMLRCVGASRKQVMRFVRLEALHWCLTAIPAGLILGTGTSWLLCAVLKYGVRGEWTNLPLFSVSLTGLICGTLVGVVTVLIAAQSPARQAASVSPLAAVSGNAGETGAARPAAIPEKMDVAVSLGIGHATGVRKNLFLMAGSFALTIVLFLVFSACLDFVHKLLPARGPLSPDITIVSEDGSNTIPGNLVASLAQIDGVEETFGLMSQPSLPVLINGKAAQVDLYAYDDVLMQAFSDSIISGEIGKVEGDSGYAMAVFDKDSELNVGDVLTIGDRELSVACVASEGVGSVSGAPVLIVSQSEFTALTGAADDELVGVMMGKGATDETVDEIRAMASGYSVIDNRSADSETYSSYWVFRIASWAFLAIVSLITVLNVLNSISMGVAARAKQYGAMRAVGMEFRQIRRMILAEAMTYAGAGAVLGLFLGLILHFILYRELIISHFGGGWVFPATATLIILLLLLISCLLAVFSASRQIRKQSITEAISEL